jgi:hypothetical protein
LGSPYCFKFTQEGFPEVASAFKFIAKVLFKTAGEPGKRPGFYQGRRKTLPKLRVYSQRSQRPGKMSRMSSSEGIFRTKKRELLIQQKPADPAGFFLPPELTAFPIGL